jgi:formate hydrogenlyase subunit 3/multisubunit Na+/H+ antiporter MnhD subunit
VAAATFAGAAALVPLVAEHHEIGCRIPLMLGSIVFEVDSFGMLFALFTSFVWLASTVYATGYMQHEHKRDRYHAFSLAVLGANMGVVLAGDLVSLYLFFEALGLLSYMMVIHNESDEAKSAAVKYFWMTLLGGLAVIGGILLTYGLGSSGAIGPFHMEEVAQAVKWSAALLMIVGFGVKAGMLPVHVWLPDAHPVAPSPASALLSGVMIKAGAYGIFRVVTAIFRPEVAEHVAEELWHFTSEIGLVVLWIGVATMFVGVVLALLQENAKRMLAYHSVSQMGFILLGIGAAGYLGSHGAMGYAGGLFHILNHALFKACLFLGVGAVFFRTGQLNMYKLGGLWRRMPFTFAFTLIAACGITGVPFFNGFVSKCLLHHALVESVELHHLASLQVAEWIFIVTCGGTACSFIKLIRLVFLGKLGREHASVREAPVSMLVAMGALAAVITTLGIRPQIVLDGVFVPGLHTWGLHATLIEEFTLITGENLLSVAYAFAIGFAVFFVGMRYHLFHLHAPDWFSVNYWYVRTARGSVLVLDRLAVGYDAYRDLVSRLLARGRRALATWAVLTQRRVQRAVVTLSTGAPLLRQQHFMDATLVLLERERHATVRDAILLAVRDLEQKPDVSERQRNQTIDAVREIATEIAMIQFDARRAVIGKLARSGRVASLRGVPKKAIATLREGRRLVAETAIRLAPKRMRGQNVARQVSATADELVQAEEFGERLRRESAAQATWSTRSRQIRPWMGTEGRSAHERVELGGLERVGAWLSGVGRVLAESVVQERFPWMIEERLDREDIQSIRLAVKRYVRDTSFNVAMIVLMFLLFALSVIKPT